MSAQPGQPLDALDSPQLLLDLDVVDANLRRMTEAFKDGPTQLRVHFKSLKCSGLAKYIAARGCSRFLAAKLNEAEVLADAGLTDILLANQIVGPIKMRRLAALARRATVTVCVDDGQNVADLSRTAREAGVTIGVLIEVNLGMDRCGVEPGEEAVPLARQVQESAGLRFLGLQGYQGHLQLLTDLEEKRTKCLEGLGRLIATRRLIEKTGVPVTVVTGGGTGTWDWTRTFDGMTEVQPGSFILMDCAYHAVRPEFGCSLSILSTVVSRRPGRYILDAGTKAISKDFGNPVLKGRPQDRVARMAEEHTRVETEDSATRVGERREVLPAHCCATMNLHRTCVAVRRGRVEAVWPIEASGRYD
jgi:D-serine deaminase-like pyridoxal phosphate-dependent protein